VVVVFDELNKEDLVEILKNPNNPVLLSKRQDFRAYDIDVKFEDEALHKIAEMAAMEKTGARGLVSAMEKILIPFEKKLPSTEVRRLVVTPELVDHPEAEVASIINNPDDPERLLRFEKARDDERDYIRSFVNERIAQIEQNAGLSINDTRIDLITSLYLQNVSDINTAVEDFMDMYKQVKIEEASLPDKIELDIAFDDSAVDELIKLSMEEKTDAGSLVFQVAKKLEYGLKLVQDRTGLKTFVINDEAVRDMEGYVNQLVKEFYRQEYEPYQIHEGEGDE
jgi:ATP-dependent protease Clp ATPase subunit